MTEPRSPYDETICAVATAPGPAGIAVIRVSGPAAYSIAKHMVTGPGPDRSARLRTIRKRNGELIDRGIVLGFHAPGSFTGEDVVEFHVHGGRAVTAAMLEEICYGGLARIAEAGEFTRRAFVNGLMDLAAVEGLSDLLAAETEAQRRLASANAHGAQSALYSDWRSRIASIRAAIEAELDFPEEEDIPGSVAIASLARVPDLAGEIAAHLDGYSKGEIITDGFRVVLLGAPNVGKSSLLNAFAGRDAAIVSAQAGTTRDLIDVALDLDGYKVIMTDTAGIRANPGDIEGMGIGRALDRAGDADLVLWLVGPESRDEDRFPRIADASLVLTKADTGWIRPDDPSLRVSVVTGEGLEALLEFIADKVRNRVAGVGVVPTRRRQQDYLARCRDALERAGKPEYPLEIKAEWLRVASSELGRLVGDVGVEDLLEEIFSRFCIGK